MTRVIWSGSFIQLHDRTRFITYPHHQFLWRPHPDVRAPAQDPALDFFQTTELQFQNDRAARDLADALRFVPFPFGNEPGGKGIELQSNALLLSRGMHAEAAAQD